MGLYRLGLARDLNAAQRAKREAVSGVASASVVDEYRGPEDLVSLLETGSEIDRIADARVVEFRVAAVVTYEDLAGRYSDARDQRLAVAQDRALAVQIVQGGD